MVIMKRGCFPVASWISIVLVLLFLVIPPLSATAAPSSYFLNVPIVGQSPMSNWCWIACGTSIVQFAGYNITKNDFALATIGNTTSDVTGTVLDVQTGLQNWGIQSTCVPNALPFSTVKNNIYPGRPCVAAIGFTGGFVGHMVVIDGYDESTVLGTIIEIMDPSGSGSRQYCDFAYFTSNSNYQWVNSIYNIYI